MPRAAVAVAAAFVLAASDARAARFTTALDPLEEGVAQRRAALPEPLPKEQRKTGAAYDKALAVLGGDAADLPAEVKMAQRAAKALRKVAAADAELAGEVEDAVAALGEEAEAYAGGVAEDLAAEPESKAKAKADRGVDAALILFEEFAGESDVLQQLKDLAKAMKKLAPAVKVVEGGGGGGGGGGGDTGCWYAAVAPSAGDAFAATVEGGSPFAFDGVSRMPNSGGAGLRSVTFYSCSGDDGVTLAFAWYTAEPPVGVPLLVGTMSPVDATYGVITAGFQSTANASGTLTFTEVNAAAGIYAATFEVSSGAPLVTFTGSFRITGMVE